jgi:hypothetical protein
MPKLFLTILIVFLATTWSVAQDKWAVADSETVRLPPTRFSQLPKKIVKYLQLRGCLIPQSFFTTEPHNVIRGEFAAVGQADWAVLCSRSRKSSILIFWRGSSKKVSAIANTPDSHFLQTVTGDGKIGFSRLIDPVGKDYIERHYREYGGRKPPRLTHQGINDAIIEKASVVHYFHRGRWLELQGAD